MTKIMIAPYQRINITDTEVIFRKQRVPLAGAHAEVETQNSGLFGRNVRTVLLVTGQDGSQLVAQVGAGFGTKGGASRTWEAAIRRAAAAINTAAQAEVKVIKADKNITPDLWY